MHAYDQNPEVRRLQEMINRQNVDGASLNLRYQGLMSLFSAACVSNNTREMDNLREQVHGLIDAILDSNATIHMLTRQLIEVIGRT